MSTIGGNTPMLGPVLQIDSSLGTANSSVTRAHDATDSCTLDNVVITSTNGVYRYPQYAMKARSSPRFRRYSRMSCHPNHVHRQRLRVLKRLFAVLYRVEVRTFSN